MAAGKDRPVLGSLSDGSLPTGKGQLLVQGVGQALHLWHCGVLRLQCLHTASTDGESHAGLDRKIKQAGLPRAAVDGVHNEH